MPSKREDIEFDRAYVKAHGLHGFLKLAWPVISTDPYVDGWHPREIGNHLEAVSTLDNNGTPYCRHLLVNVPPGATKSLNASVAWPAYVWGPGQDPKKRFVYVCFDDSLATEHGRYCRELIESEWYQERWPLRLVDKADGNLRNEHGGKRFATSVGGRGTGRHADIVVVDDPIKPADTQGTAGVTRKQLDKVKKWWSGTMSTRNANKNVARVIIMQRLHEDDLAGVVLRTKRYIHLCLPMRYDATRPCRTPFGGDPRTVDGELLCPERWPAETVRELEESLGDDASAQLQQRPASASGLVFKRAWLRFYDQLPREIDEWACSWDMTFKDTRGSDYVCGQVWAKSGADYFLVERVYERLNFPNTLTAVLAQLKRYPQIGAKLIEDKANGPAIISTLERKVPGLIAVEPQGKKEARAAAVSHLHRAGNVWYPRVFEHDDTDTGHVHCLVNFPLARHDDSVDAETQMLNYWSQQNNALLDLMIRRAQGRNQ